MARLIRPAVVLLTGAMSLSGPAFAQECLEDMAEIDAENVGIRQHLSDQELSGYTTLRQAARFLMQNEREEACEELAETYVDMIGERREALVDEGLMVDVDEQQRVDQLMNAPKVGELERSLSAGNMIGSDLRNYDNQDLGDITDVVIEPGSGNISHVLVESGGFLGLGEDVVAVPLTALRVTDNGNTFVIDMARDRFEEAPEVNEARLGEEGWAVENDSYFMAAE